MGWLLESGAYRAKTLSFYRAVWEPFLGSNLPGGREILIWQPPIKSDGSNRRKGGLFTAASWPPAQPWACRRSCHRINSSILNPFDSCCKKRGGLYDAPLVVSVIRKLLRYLTSSTSRPSRVYISLYAGSASLVLQSCGSSHLIR